MDSGLLNGVTNVTLEKLRWAIGRHPNFFFSFFHWIHFGNSINCTPSFFLLLLLLNYFILSLMCAYSTSMSPLTSTSVHHIMPETHAQKQIPSPVHSQPRSSEDESHSECTEDELSDEDDDMTSVKHESSDQAPKALFLNFSSNLTEQSFGKKKPRSKRQTAYRVNGVNILNRSVS